MGKLRLEDDCSRKVENDARNGDGKIKKYIYILGRASREIMFEAMHPEAN